VSRLKLLLLVICLSAPLSAEIIFYQFDDPAIEQRFNQLITDLRCPKCQNNNLADSNAPLSVDLKQIIYDKLHAQATDEEIITFLKERYGDFIYYKPPVNASTWFIWFGPFLVLIFALVLMTRFFNRKQPDPVGSSSERDYLATVDQWQKESQEND
jgi:cytochrome c-type biogenesis protein CcmH